MDAAANLITSMAGLLGIFVWPIIVIVALYLLIKNFKEPIANFICQADKFTIRGLGGELTAEITNRIDRVRATNEADWEVQTSQTI